MSLLSDFVAAFSPFACAAALRLCRWLLSDREDALTSVNGLLPSPSKYLYPLLAFLYFIEKPVLFLQLHSHSQKFSGRHFTHSWPVVLGPNISAAEKFFTLLLWGYALTTFLMEFFLAPSIFIIKKRRGIKKSNILFILINIKVLKRVYI
ncbi:hypothetical protein YYC_02898 [Plasmodium yoelii 17X]|uniref:Uncharacterized protein n=1 Tax=Plasmodium yoelii 17X TaxID=1323249 RepID=V7PK80_PLAYE|nr:hypothetical protein YYC_02898 [Plasmodium yoelii 17X]